MNGCIIFVDNDDRLASVMLAEEQRKGSQGRFKIHWTGIAPCDLAVQYLFVGIQSGTGLQLDMPLEFLRNQLGNLGKGLLPGGIFHILEREVDNGILTLIGGVFFTALPDQLILEVLTCVFASLFKKDTEHIHIQRFAKPPGAGKQGNQRFSVQKIPNQQCFVHIIVITGSLLKIRDSDRKGLGLLNSDRMFCFARNYICRNHPGSSLFDCPDNFTVFAHLLHSSGRCPHQHRSFRTSQISHTAPPQLFLVLIIPGKTKWVNQNFVFTGEISLENEI